MSAAPRERDVEVGGRRLRVLEFGDPAARPVVFSHGAGLHAWMWSTQAAALAEGVGGSEPIYAVCVDHRGHGDSDKDFPDFEWSNIAADLAEVVAELDLGRPDAVGHSMGGAVLVLAEAARRGLFRSLLLVDPIILPQPIYLRPITIAEQPMAARAIRRRADWPSFTAMIESYGRKPPFVTWASGQLDLYVRRGAAPQPGGGVRLKCSPEVEARCYVGGHATDPWPLLPAIQTPTLILQGTEADTRGLVDIERIAAAMPNARAAGRPGGHFLPMEAPDGLVGDIAAWLGERCGERPGERPGPRPESGSGGGEA